MIEINLLDQSKSRGRGPRRTATARPGRPSGGGAGKFVVTMLVVLMLALNGGFGFWAWNKVHSAGKNARDLRDKIASVEKQIDERFERSAELRMFEQVITNQKEVLGTLDPPERVLWSEKINMLSKLMPPDVFLSKIEITERIEMVETAESKKARETWKRTDKTKRSPKEPEPVYRPVIHYTVDLTGLAIGDDNVEQFNNVLAFHRAMIGYEETNARGEVRRFMDGFIDDVDFGMIEASVHEGVPVNEFVFKLKTVKHGEGQKPASNLDVAQSAGRDRRVAAAN